MEKKSGAKPNPILWFVFVVVVPTIVATTLAIVILGVAGIDVVSWAKDKASQIPIVSTWVEQEEEQNIEEQNEKAEAKIVKQNEEITELKQEITQLEGTIDQLNQDILKTESQHESTTSDEDEMNEEVDTIKKMSASFKQMKSKQAALIFEDLEDGIAIDILTELSNDVRGDILEAMEPSKAAHLTTLFVNSQ